MLTHCLLNREGETRKSAETLFMNTVYHTVETRNMLVHVLTNFKVKKRDVNVRRDDTTMKSFSAAFFVLVLPLLAFTPCITAFTPIGLETRLKCTVLRMEKIPFLRRFRRKTMETPPLLVVGSRLPDMNVEMLCNTNDGDTKWISLSLLQAMGEGMSILVLCVPSTKTCDSIHLPGYVEASQKLESLGINKIAIMTTKDRLVSQKFVLTTSDGTTVQGTDRAKRIPLVPAHTAVTVLACGDENLVKNLGFTKKMGSGIRSNRFILVLEDGIVHQVLREEGVEDCTAASASRVVEFLTPEPPSSPDAEGIEIDFRLIIAAGAILSIALYLLLATMLSEYGFTLPGAFHPIEAVDDPSPFDFQLLKDHL